ncbi:hypothetical protein RMATCC62417_15272 [Rhizopus microsporus]|nr:hypothetical protein RMATCC62417_15272 [Rhizopus microsporus]
MQAPRPGDSMNALYWRQFNMERIDFQGVHQLARNNGRKGFTSTIHSDGVALELICDRPAGAGVKPLTPAGVAREIDLKTAAVWNVGPGVHEVFVHFQEYHHHQKSQRQRHRIRKTFTSEYYQITGYKSANIKRTKYDRTHQAARTLIAQMSSTKTTDLVRFSEAL